MSERPGNKRDEADIEKDLRASFTRIKSLMEAHSEGSKGSMGQLLKWAKRGSEREHGVGGMFPADFADTLIRLISQKGEIPRELIDELNDERAKLEALLEEMSD